MRGVARVSLLAIVLLLSSAAAEAAAGKRIGVPKFEGAQEALVRKEVMQSLKSHGFEVVGSRDDGGRDRAAPAPASTPTTASRRWPRSWRCRPS